MDLEKTITLRKPITLGDLQITELKLREPTAGELARAASATNNVSGVIELISVVAKVSRKVAEDLCQRDFREADDFFAQFSAFSPAQIGETSSQT